MISFSGAVSMMPRGLDGALKGAAQAASASRTALSCRRETAILQCRRQTRHLGPVVRNGPRHMRGIVPGGEGCYLGEMFYLTELADWLRANRRNRFLFTGPPLRLPGAVGSPATPVATV